MDDRKAQPAAGLEDARALAYRSIQVVDILERHERDDEVERTVRKRERGSVGEVHLDRGIGCACGFDHLGRQVDADHRVSARREIAREATLAASEVEGAPARAGTMSKKRSR